MRGRRMRSRRMRSRRMRSRRELIEPTEKPKRRTNGRSKRVSRREKKTRGATATAPTYYISDWNVRDVQDLELGNVNYSAHLGEKEHWDSFEGCCYDGGPESDRVLELLGI